MQNKLHYAVHGHTAAELIHERASADKMHMGLTTWNKAPDGKVLAGDVTVGKYYRSMVVSCLNTQVRFLKSLLINLRSENFPNFGLSRIRDLSLTSMLS